VLKDSRDFEALEVKPAPGAPAAVTDAQSTPLTKALVQAPAGKQAALIKEYAAGKGEKYSVAFADAIPQLRGVNQSRVREALDERLASLTVESIVTYLKCKNAELRRAAAVAVGLRDELSLIPDLIDRLGDANEAVWLAAVQSLQLLSGKEFGPQRGATPAQKSAAIADWKAWHQNAEKPE
jgi:HEAT repeat protein